MRSLFIFVQNYRQLGIRRSPSSQLLGFVFFRARIKMLYATVHSFQYSGVLGAFLLVFPGVCSLFASYVFLFGFAWFSLFFLFFAIFSYFSLCT